MLRLQEIVGQPDAIGHLTRLVEQDRLPHAMLFVGPGSTGKTTAARALAGALFCKDPTVTRSQACGFCASCTKMEQSSHGDFHEVVVTTKSIPVAAIRDAARALSMRAMEGGAKFLLIPDAERMNVPAQNALLKTLEEPPGDTHIVLTTARLRSILPTVVSRCQRVHFAPLPTEEVARVVHAQRNVSEDDAKMIAALAQGSLGAALELDFEALVERRDRVAAIDRALDGRSGKSAIEALEAAADLAHDRKDLLESLDMLLIWLHDQMLIAADAPRAGLANVDRTADLELIAAQRGLTKILARADDVMEARRHVEAAFNWNPQMIAEQLCLALAGHSRLERLPL